MTLSIQNAIDTIIASVPGAPFPDTVDTVKLGDAAQDITGIVVTFLATCEVIEQAVQLGANLIITHEPTFYNHRDTTDWLSHHPSYQAKRRLIEESRIVIWRFHDYLHSLPPDRQYGHRPAQSAELGSQRVSRTTLRVSDPADDALGAGAMGQATLGPAHRTRRRGFDVAV